MKRTTAFPFQNTFKCLVRWTRRARRLGCAITAITLGLSSVPAVSQQGDDASFQVIGGPTAQTILPYPHFFIPFDVRGSARQIAEVQLWVSADGGKSWQFHSSRAPTDQRFEFVAPADGVYQFSVRTVDRNGTAYPSGTAPLVVGVDQTKPVINLAADARPDGQLQIRVHVVEPFLDLGSAKLKVRGSQSLGWSDVPVTLQPIGDGQYRGEATVPLPPGDRLAVVMAIKDRAGHEGLGTLQIDVPKTAQQSFAPQLAGAPSPGEDEPASVIPSLPGAIAWRPVEESRYGSRGSSAKEPPTGNRSHSPRDQLGPGRLTSGELMLNPPRATSRGRDTMTPFRPDVDARSLPRLPAPVEELPPPPPLEAADRSASQQAPVGAGADDALTHEPDGQTSREQQPGEGRLDLPLTTNSPSTSNAPDRWASESGGRYVATTPAADDPSVHTAGSIDRQKSRAELQLDGSQRAARSPKANPMDRAFHSRSRLFSLDYDVADLRDSPLASVELWGTEDGGTTWQKWGEDEDRQSPFHVQVGNDGLFGFRMVVVSASGLVSNRPHAGDDADMWILVDTQLPAARIHRAVYGRGNDADKLLIDYSAEDEFLADRPVALYFSQMREGPWHLIASGLPPRGTYAWKVPSDAPSAIFLRIEANDKAGNVGSSRLEVPVELTRLAPKGRIRGFQPIINQ